MLQRDSFFRRRDENVTRPNAPVIPAPSPLPSGGATTIPPVDIKPHDRKEAKLVVGRDIKMKGAEISDCDTLVVEGRMEATLDSRVLEITPHGVFQGTISVDNAEIHGRFEGELTVRKHLLIHATGRVTGKIHYAKLKIEDGAELTGEVTTLEKSQAPSVKRAAAGTGVV